ncbi:MAG: Respiratory supercomplex factor 1, mitochondrial [Ramalina farinacea]|uniref:Respiratory supercomplex factor 1, mitochondrial n=1 Tax=Ramalina farinacea TaxID=258253 RepID=A0AA43TYK9_9LECA|nr:Respiratory supercomplex factor 1, mitochondrial [Ramalina farinacea]
MSETPLPSSMDSDFFNENRWEKFTRRIKEEPLVPFGVGLTCWAFYNAARSIRSGNSTRTNRMFRFRLYAQSFTIVAMLGGSFYYNADRLKRNEYVKLKKKREAQEKKRRGVIEAIRLQANAAKAKEEKMQQIEADTQGGTLPVGPPPMSDEERAAAQPQSTSLLGETEQGGIFGIGHLKTFWKSRRPKQSDDDESSR